MTTQDREQTDDALLTKPAISRRRTLKGIAGVAGLTVAGGAGLYALTGPSVAASVSIGDTDVQTDDGDLSFVDLDLTDYFAVWDGFDVPVAAVAFRDRIAEIDGSGSVISPGPHELYDQRGDDANPVLLENISTQGNGGDGWGGPGEYASTFDTKTTPDTAVINQPGVDGPATATAGWVHADVAWRLLSDDLSAHPAKSIETPALVGTDVPEVDNPDDGTTDVHTYRMTKEVYLYRLLNDGETEDLLTEDGTPVKLMGGDDGTRQKIQAVPEFTVDVVNQVASPSTDGDGTTTAG